MIMLLLYILSQRSVLVYLLCYLWNVLFLSGKEESPVDMDTITLDPEEEVG